MLSFLRLQMLSQQMALQSRCFAHGTSLHIL